MEKNKTTNNPGDAFGGFTEAFDYLSGNGLYDKKEDETSTLKANNTKDRALEVDPEELEQLTLSKKNTKVVEEEDEELDLNDGVEEDVESDEEEIDDVPALDDDPDEIVKKLKSKKDKAAAKEVEEDVEDEQEIVDTFFNLFSEELGWEVDEEDKPKSVKDLISTMAAIIEENSKPAYASEDLKKLDEYVKNGGSIDKFLKDTLADVDLNKLDLEDENNQKKILREYLKTLGLTDDKIAKRISRYEEALVLEDEAKEAAEALAEYKQKTAQKLLKEQEDVRKRQLVEQQSFVENVKKTIEQLDEIQGVQISSKQKKELFDYLFKVDAEGKTAYQKDYSSNVLNLITSAFVVKEGKSIFKKAQTNATTNVVKELQKKLKSKNLRNQKPYESSNSTLDTLSLISKTLSRN